MRKITRREVLLHLPRRPRDANKGSFGSVAAVAGSLAYRGAAALCVEGALRCGAGLVYLASVEPVIQIALTRTPECCALPCRTDPDGGILAADAAAVRQRFADRPAVLLAGPGLGSSAGRVLNALLGVGAPWKAAVLDADALNALAAGELGSFPLLPAATVITPHPGEAARLLGSTVERVQADRESAAIALAERYGCVAVLKGAGTVIASAESGRETLLNTTGNAGLARGGSGDVLTGMLAAMLAQGLSPMDAAVCAVWLHGAAADLCAERTSPMTMLPHDLLTDLAQLVRDFPCI
ncbi:MAG: NAD(P)H-hydrate dehydratase [Gemmiger sp.]|uniref:NAD(P)H-hydrate dehydratase n=1 Tax=Gemmiger sp. TaxID=2049027 RepID=UPI002E76C6A5|nr:NAD(P)H-hydrate dehydratase [Gemmiger sp.]MEE0801634.1 NAD(P)H-hydrate dehydratase [Gemmiger sp.]